MTYARNRVTSNIEEYSVIGWSWGLREKKKPWTTAILVPGLKKRVVVREGESQ